MYRTALRASPSALRAIRPANFSGSRRLLSTASAPRKGTWRGTGLRWGLAIAAVYFYNTSPIFADELPPQAGPAPSPFSDDDNATIEAIIEEKRKQAAATTPPPPAQPQKVAEPTDKAEASDVAPAVAAVPEADSPEAGSPEALEQEAEAQGAFDPETGEINWDCPCLGGMAHGPCGEEFKAAFSCFVYSKEEPKGMDCIDKFQHMQDCFRKYPEIYGSEIADDEEGEASASAQDAALAKDASEAPAQEQTAPSQPEKTTPSTTATPVADKAKEAKVEQVGEELNKEVEEVVPKKAHDATESNKGRSNNEV